MEAERVVASLCPHQRIPNQRIQGHDSAMLVWVNRRRSSGRLILHKCRPLVQRPTLLLVRVGGCRLLLVYGSAVVTLFRRVIIFPKNHFSQHTAKGRRVPLVGVRLCVAWKVVQVLVRRAANFCSGHLRGLCQRTTTDNRAVLRKICNTIRCLSNFRRSTKRSRRRAWSSTRNLASGNTTKRECFINCNYPVK